MYFPYGWPKLFQTFDNEDEKPFLDIQHNRYEVDLANVGYLVASISESSIYIWSASQQRFLAGSLQRSSASLDKDGTNKRILWGPSAKNSQMIVIITSIGHLMLYTITSNRDDITDFNLPEEYHYINLGPRSSVKIEFKQTIQFDSPAICITNVWESIFVCTMDGNLLKVNWSGEILDKVTISEIKLIPSLPEQDKNIFGTMIIFSPSLQQFGLIFSNGTAAVLRYMNKMNHSTGFFLSVINASTIALNAKHSLAAVGTEIGEVLLYHLEGSKPARTITLAHWGITPEMTGGVSCLEWSNDNCVLAVGWKKRGFTVWSIYGCRIMSTIPQLETTSITKTGGNYLEPLSNGVAALSWGCEGYQLLLGCLGHAKGKLMQFSFFKSSLAPNPNLNWSERILLQGDDRLLLLSYKGQQLDNITWEHLHVPFVYLQDNWPVKRISVSRDGLLIAVAGRRGATLYNSNTKRWKLFGDRNQEQQIECVGLSWFNHILIIANYNLNTKDYEILMYPKNHLDNTSLVGKSNIPEKRKPQFLDCNENNLLLFTTDNFVFQYIIVPTYTNEDISSVKLQLIHQISMAKITASPLSLTLLPNLNIINKSSQSNIAKCLVLHSSGLLALNNTYDNHMVPLAGFVEQFWVANYSGNIHEYSVTEKDFGNTLWAYGEAGLQVWFPFFTDKELQATKLMSRDNSLEFDLEVYPIGFMNELGVIVGITQEIQYSLCSPYPCFELKVKMHPFLHSILRHLIENKDEETAIKIARKFSFIPHFAHSLELLLHETLEEDKTNSETLPRVIEFLRKFSQFPEIVMRCARKRDPSVWSKLFSLVGSPKLLFEQCVAAKRVQSAASYLRILQFLEGTRESRACALKLLDETLNSDDMELAGDLMRFLQPSDEMIEASRRKEENSGDDGQIDLDDQEFYLQELKLARYARKLLGQQQIRKLLRFAKGVNHDLRPWLIRERRRAAVLEDFDTAIAMVHLQFSLPFPDSLPKKLTVQRKKNSVDGEDSVAFAKFELNTLLEEMLKAECIEWSLVISAVLLDVEKLVTLLKQHSPLYNPFKSALEHQECGGYKEMAVIIEEQFKDIQIKENTGM